jgi:hypothetical protein
MMPTDLKQQFGRDGFVINRSEVLPEGVVRRASEGMDAIRRGEYDTGRPPEGSPWKPGDSENLLCKIELPQKASKGVMELVSHPTIGKWAAAAMGAKKVQVWWVQLLYKPPTLPNAKAPTANFSQRGSRSAMSPPRAARCASFAAPIIGACNRSAISTAKI